MSLLYELAEMSILSYICKLLKPKDGLPDLKGSLSSIFPSQAIALANKEVARKVIQRTTTPIFMATENVSIRCVVGQSKLLQELDSICFCLCGDHEYRILFKFFNQHHVARAHALDGFSKNSV